MHQVYKDADPWETVRRLRRILGDLGITPHEALWSSATPHCHSVRIEDAVLPIGTNGKGISRAYALASAYAEMLERLQTGFLLFNRYGLMPPPDPLMPDVRARPFDEVAKDHADLAPWLMPWPLPESLAAMHGDTVRCAPFYNVTADRVEELPLDWIDFATGSNGCCAGNTPEEALVQGIGEVFERYAMTQLFTADGPAAPTIPADSINDSWLTGLREDSGRRGYEVVIKDCSLGGTIPVLATVLIGDERRCTVRFAGSPVFETALERCLTETFQGKPRLRPLDLEYPSRQCPSFDSPRSRRLWELYRTMVDGSGALPDRLALGDEASRAHDAFLPEFAGHRHALRFLVDRLRRLGHTLYVRDVSFLGFPSYRVYVPALMDYHHGWPMRGQSTGQGQLRTLLRLAAASREEVRDLAVRIEEDLNAPGTNATFRVVGAKSVLAEFLYLDASTDFFVELPTPERLLAALFFRAGDFARAHRYLTQYVEQAGADATTYERCCVGYLKLRSQGISDGAVLARQLASLFGVALAREVAADLADPDLAFQYYRLPLCGDCAPCPVAAACRYPEWSQVSARRRQAAWAHPIDQAALHQVFA